jgi:lysophospholipase L1-like esterase
VTLRRLASALLLLGALPSLAAAQTTPRKYLAFGDSITAGVGDDPARAAKGYPPRLQNLLQSAGVSATVLNFGEGGENTMMGLGRINGVLAQGSPGDVLILMEGTNDISKQIDLETTIFDLEQMATRAEDLGLSVIHATVIPRYPEANRDPENALTDQLNGRIRNLAGVRQRRLADPNEAYRNTPNLFAGFYSTERPDPVGHPNAAGYDILARVFFNVIQGIDTVSPVPGIVSPVKGARNVSPDTAISVDIWDFGTGIDLANTFLLINGQQVQAVPVGNTRRANITYQPPAPLSGIITIGLRSRDLATPPNAINREIASFAVQGAGALPGDVNQDGRVDGMDLIRFGRSFGSLRGDNRYNANADFNADGSVDGTDLAVLAANFGRTGTGTVR